MNIWAKRGDKVFFTGVGGHDVENKTAKEVFEVGKTYTVNSTIVYDWHTSVSFIGIEGLFNSVMFEDVE